jgi:hypothetical protein
MSRLARNAAALACAALATGGFGLGGSGGASDSPACGWDARAWHPVGLPAGATAAGAVATTGCPYVTASGATVWLGREHSWRAVWTAPATVAGVYGAGSGTRRVLVTYGGAATPAGAAVSTDGGRHFAPVAGLDPAAPLTAVSGAGDTVYALSARPAGVPLGLPALWVSGDGGRSFARTPSPYATGATAVTYRPDVPTDVWLNDTRADATVPAAVPQLWHSTDGGTTFAGVVLPVRGYVSAVAYTAGGLYAAGQFGAVASADDGATWRTLQTGGREVTGIAPLGDAAGDALGIVDGRPYVLSPVAAAAALGRGLPKDCRVADVVTVPDAAGYVARCADGTAFSRGGGIVAGDPADDLGRDEVIAAAPVDALTPLVTYQLPHADVAQSSGTLAFDGRDLYYLPVGDHHQDGGAPPATLRVGSVRAATGVAGRSFDVRLGALADNHPPEFRGTGIAFDTKRQLLYVVSHRGSSTGTNALKMYAVDLRTGRARFLFAVPMVGVNVEPAVAYDASTDDFVLAAEAQSYVAHVSRTGRIVMGCNTQVPDGPVASAVQAVGDGGGFYLADEDDRSVYQFDRGCRLVRLLVHRSIAESGSEDDNLVCDGQTFDVPALWLRDSIVDTVSAYAAPAATYCPLHTALAVASPPVAQPRTRVPVCATLTAGASWPVAGQLVSWVTADRQHATSVTDPRGRTCTLLRTPARGRMDVTAQFYGTRATPQLAPSGGGGALAALPGVLPPHPLPGEAVATAVALVRAAPLLPPTVARPAPIPHGQTQPVQQVQTSSQTQLSQQNAAGLAGQEDPETQLAVERTDDSDAAVTLWFAALAVSVPSAVALRRRTADALCRSTSRRPR